MHLLWCVSTAALLLRPSAALLSRPGVGCVRTEQCARDRQRSSPSLLRMAADKDGGTERGVAAQKGRVALSERPGYQSYVQADFQRGVVAMAFSAVVIFWFFAIDPEVWLGGSSGPFLVELMSFLTAPPPPHHSSDASTCVRRNLLWIIECTTA